MLDAKIYNIKKAIVKHQMSVNI